MDVVEGLPRPPMIPVCQRCRHRKQKCDSDIIGCKPCMRSGNECYVEDPDTGRKVPRAYVQRLEDHAHSLRQAVRNQTTNQQSNDLSVPAIISEQRPKAPQAPNRRYLGTSSGISFIEYAITFAKTHKILDSSQNPPNPAQSNLDRETVSRLFDYFSITQWYYRIITRDEFDHHLSLFFSDVSNEHVDSAIVVHTISAISTFYLGAIEGNAMASNLAEIQYEKALHLLPTILPYRTIETLQTILLVLLYSFLNPQKPVTWHLLGAALRLATFLRLHEDNAATDSTYSAKDANVRRNLFWTLYSIDRAVGNTLGRPTALQDVDIQTPFPELNIDGTQDSYPAANAAIASHCFQIRRLQSEAADVLYQKIRPMAPDWPTDIQQRVGQWLIDAPMSQASPQMQEWINHAYYNLTMFINRPSLISATSSFEGASKRSFASASKVLKLYAQMHSRNAIDYPEIRITADWKEINEDLQRTRMVLSAMVEHWRYGKRILDIYCQLCDGTIRLFVQLVPITVGEQNFEQKPALQDPTDTTEALGINPAPPLTELMDASFQFQDVLMNDDLDYWLDQPIAGFGTPGGPDVYSGANDVGSELDPWLYRM
ncbi:fungal-specific transcription factor domain-containing protein [Exophiala viscosa]|uniref:fungal-specific transcription factor domain-containing protein n=1 Tax=Exophiala viscosa TaxID=2486360 RepID=UPI00218F8ABF|nr:fungal-specific transcription factor domain-containing protein [Exophiala viscosa]